MEADETDNDNSSGPDLDAHYRTVIKEIKQKREYYIINRTDSSFFVKTILPISLRLLINRFFGQIIIFGYVCSFNMKSIDKIIGLLVRSVRNSIQQ